MIYEVRDDEGPITHAGSSATFTPGGERPILISPSSARRDDQPNAQVLALPNGQFVHVGDVVPVKEASDA